MKNKLIFLLIPLLVIIAAFSVTIQDSFGETRHECRVSAVSDKSLTPVERQYALKLCSTSENKISSFEEYYSEELHNECTRILKEKTRLNHVARLNDLEECNKLQEIDASSKLQKISKFSKVTIAYCDEKYEIFLLIGAKKMWNQAGGTTPQCLKLYSAPMWSSTADDRYSQLHNFLIDEVKKSVDENKEERQKDVREARLNNPIFYHLTDIFKEQKEKISNLEKQLQEKNITPNYSQQDFFNEKYRNCLKIVYDQTLSSQEKIRSLDKCSKIQTDEPIAFNEKEILEYSKNAVAFCERSYDKFLKSGLSDYYAYMKSPKANTCVMLYTEPLAQYNQENRTQVLEKIVYDKTIENNKKYIERSNFIATAHLDVGMVPILSDLITYQKQKIGMLENIIKSEKIENAND